VIGNKVHDHVHAAGMRRRDQAMEIGRVPQALP
jgi:hypothetical protein